MQSKNFLPVPISGGHDKTPSPISSQLHHYHQSALLSDLLSSWHVHAHLSQPLCLYLLNICSVTLSCLLILSVLLALKEKLVFISTPRLMLVPLPTTGDLYRSKVDELLDGKQRTCLVSFKCYFELKRNSMAVHLKFVQCQTKNINLR